MGFFERMGILTEQSCYFDSYGRSLGGLIKAVYTVRRMPKKLHSNNRIERCSNVLVLFLYSEHNFIKTELANIKIEGLWVSLITGYISDIGP